MSAPTPFPQGGSRVPFRATPPSPLLTPHSPTPSWRSFTPSFPPLHTLSEEDELSIPSSPSSYAPTPASPAPGPVPVPTEAFAPYLSSTSPFPSLTHLPNVTLTELRVSDNSHSQANPAQRKKGGCKGVQVTVTVGAAVYTVQAKCDVRKSFSNRSFSKYYDRGQYAVVAVEATGGVVLVVEEAKRGRDGKHFVAMERSCTAPYAAEDGNPRHPLLAFAADAVYRLTVATREEEEVRVDVKCLFEQGAATVNRKGRVGCAEGEERGKKREREDDEDDEWKEGKRPRALPPVRIDRPLSSSAASSASSSSSSLSSMSSTEAVDAFEAMDSPCPTLSPAPSSPESESSSFCSSPLAVYLTVSEEVGGGLFSLDELPAAAPMVGQFSSPAMWGSSAPWVSPWASPLGLRGMAELKESGGSPFIGSWLEGVMAEMPELVLR